MNKIKNFLSSDYARRAYAIVCALLITGFICFFAGIKFNECLGAVSCAVVTTLLCIFIEERAYHAGSLRKAIEKMTVLGVFRYFFGFVLDVELTYFFVFGGMFRLYLGIISVLCIALLKHLDNGKEEEKNTEEETQEE